MAEVFPTSEMEMTHILVISDMDAAKAFYRDILGAEINREYGGTSCVLRFLGSWLLLVTGGGPTKDKPTVTFNVPANPDLVSAAFTIRVPDCEAAYQNLLGRGAEFLTPPVHWESEIRCFFRDPDGHLFELSEV